MKKKISLTINGKPWTIAGVMPREFEYPGRRYELWAPLPSPRTADLPPLNRTAHYLQLVGRVKAGVSAEQANAEIKAIAGALAVLEQGQHDVWFQYAVASPFYAGTFERFLRAEALPRSCPARAA